MTGDCLLDTNAVVGLLNKDPLAISAIRPLNAYLPSIVVGELYYGAFKSARASENLAKLRRFLLAAVSRLKCQLKPCRPLKAQQAMSTVA